MTHPSHSTTLSQNRSSTRRILRTPDAALYLGLSPSTLEKMRCQGDGPRFIRLGGRAVGYDIQELDAWLATQAGQPVKP